MIMMYTVWVNVKLESNLNSQFVYKLENISSEILSESLWSLKF